MLSFTQFYAMSRRLELVTEVNIYVISSCILIKRVPSQHLEQLAAPIVRVNIAAVCFSESLISMYQSIQCHSTEDYTKTKEIQRRTDKIILMTH